jgi:hypothetical protein
MMRESFVRKTAPSITDQLLALGILVAFGAVIAVSTYWFFMSVNDEANKKVSAPDATLVSEPKPHPVPPPPSDFK